MSSMAKYWCRYEMWAESRLPSIDCTQLQVDSCLPTRHWSGDSESEPKSRKGVMLDSGPMYVHTIPPDSCVGYATAFTLSLKSDSAGSLGMSTHRPVTSNFQP